MFYDEDLFFVWGNNGLNIWLKHYLKNTFGMVYLEKIKCYLGANFDATSKGIFLHKSKYTYNLKQFGMIEYKFTKTLLPKELMLVFNMNTNLYYVTYFFELIKKNNIHYYY